MAALGTDAADREIPEDYCEQTPQSWRWSCVAYDKRGQVIEDKTYEATVSLRSVMDRLAEQPQVHFLSVTGRTGCFLLEHFLRHDGGYAFVAGRRGPFERHDGPSPFGGGGNG